MNSTREIAATPTPPPVDARALQPSQLLETATNVLLPGLHLLFQLDDRAYMRVAPAPYSAFIGNHFRRALDRLQCLVTGFRLGEIDYDAPERNARVDQEVVYASALHHFDVIHLICETMHIRVPEEFGDASAVRKLLSGLVAY